MARAKRRREATAMALSIAAHVVVLTAFALHTPMLMRPHEESGPPEPVIPVLIMPRVPPAPPGSLEKPQPIRLHRRQLRRELATPDVEPFVPPASVPEPRPVPAKPVIQPRISVQPSPAAQLAAVLRGGRVGCANPSLLSPTEREKCQEEFGRGAGDAARIGPLADPGLERAAAARDATRRYREGGVPVGVSSPGSSGASNRNKPMDLPPLGPMRP
jgi:hypothetical protein